MKTVTVLRKPPEGTVAQNCLDHGTGALNIGACRIPYEDGHVPPKDANIDKPSSWTNDEYNGDRPYILNAKLKTRQVYTPTGRYPANVIIYKVVVASLDAQGANLPFVGNALDAYKAKDGDNKGFGNFGTQHVWRYPDADQGASRFFKQVKE